MGHNPHDTLFKRVFSHVGHAEGELRTVLPAALVERLDFSTLRVCPGSYVDEASRWRHTDLLYSVRLGDRDAFVYVLFEHQSTVDPLMAFRLLQYLCTFWESWLAEHEDDKRLPAVIP
jgi:predicted transposase/invertase (TIGR01784 family)